MNRLGKITFPVLTPTILFVVGLLLGCSSSNGAGSVSQLEGGNARESGSASISVTPLQVSKDSAPEAPVTIIDALGQELTITISPQKIATISPTATEILYAAGGSAILRDRASNYPLEAQALPDVGSAYDPSIETLVAAGPDLVILEALTQARFAPILARAGLEVMGVKAETAEEINKYILKVGKIIGQEEVASEKVDEINDRLARVGGSDGRTVLILISDQDRNLYAARPESYTGEIANTLGMVNKAAGLTDSGPYPGFSLMSLETIVAADPDVIVTITPAPDPAPRLSSMISRMPQLAELKAVQDSSIFEADVTLFLQAPGPRLIEAVELLKDGTK